MSFSCGAPYPGDDATPRCVLTWPHPDRLHEDIDGDRWARELPKETAVAEYTPTTYEIRTDWVRSNPGVSWDNVEHVEAAFDRWLAAHDAEVRAGVVTEEPEWEYGVGAPDSPHCWVGGSRELAEKNRLAGEVVKKRVKAVPAGPWVPVGEGDET